jgi:hypothetical protein
MRGFMKQTSKQGGEHRNQKRRGSDEAGEGRTVGAAMVDALEDILSWERASERAMKAAQKSDA